MRRRAAGLAALTVGVAGLVTAVPPPPSHETAHRLEERCVAMAGGNGSLLRPEYVRGVLASRDTDPPVGHAFREALQSLSRNPGEADTAAAVPVVTTIERKFIRDPRTSSLDLLPREQRDRFVDFAWHKDDFPGPPDGPNEALADEMVNALRAVRPERRANSREVAVARKEEIEKTGWEWVVAMQDPIPGQENRKLNRDALRSFVEMRRAAKREGVDLFAVSAGRDPAVAARNAARSGNPNAVASFSSHSLGLAVDFRMSDGVQTFDEVTTGDFPGLVRMRRSAVHKWLFLRGARYGWYPYMQEPWHWEYNPPGFRERFWAPMGGPPK
jgi:hypothetical protein